MADYNTLFSVMFSPGATHVERALEIYNELSTTDDEDAHVSFGIERQDDKLWLHDDGSNDTEGVINFVIACAKEFKLTGRWGFQYANTCSKPRPDGYGGGVIVIDFDNDCKVDVVDTNFILTCWLEGDEAGV